MMLQAWLAATSVAAGGPVIRLDTVGYSQTAIDPADASAYFEIRNTGQFWGGAGAGLFRYDWVTDGTPSDYEVRISEADSFTWITPTSPTATTGAGTTLTLPAGNVGDFLFVFFGYKYPTNAVTAMAATSGSWTSVADITGGTASPTTGIDTGQVRSQVYWKKATSTTSGGEGGSFTRTASTNGVLVYNGVRIRCTASDIEVQTLTLNNSTGPDPWVISGTMNLKVGDILIAYSVGNSDLAAGAQVSSTFSATGFTIAAATEWVDTTSTTGDDIRRAAAYASVTAGTQGDVTVTWSSDRTGTAIEGTIVLVRVRPVFPWESLGTTRSRVRTQTTLGGGVAKPYDVEIRDVATQTVQDSATITLTATVEI